MNQRVKNAYVELGQILENPRAFGFDERIPRALANKLDNVRRQLFEALREESPDDDNLAKELSQDSDSTSTPFVTSTSFTLTKVS